MKKDGYMYILECSDGTYYVGSTVNLGMIFIQHNNGEGSNYTQNRTPVKLIYAEYYKHVALAFEREKQVQGWSRAKKEALMQGNKALLKRLAKKVP
jgi:putative endonuclease